SQARTQSGLDDTAALPWPLPNVWLGVSVEDQKNADERIPWLLKTPAAVRWVSAEPLLSSVDLSKYLKGHTPNDKGRSGILGAVGDRRILDRREGAYLATQATDSREQDRVAPVLEEFAQETPSGN